MYCNRISWTEIARICAVFGVLGVVPCAGAFAGASLPIVNIGAGAVSARTMFGEPLTANTESDAGYFTVTAAPLKKNVAARTATAPRDVLVPKKPSSDIWARNAAHIAADSPLRLPRASEFAMISDEFMLPEESLSAVGKPARAATMPISAPVQKVATQRVIEPAGYADDIFGAAPAPIAQHADNYDNQLAQLTESYKKLEAKLATIENNNTENVVRPMRVAVSTPTEKQIEKPTARASLPSEASQTRRAVASRASAPEITGRIRMPDETPRNEITASNDVKIRQMVVPMDDEQFYQRGPALTTDAALRDDTFAYNEEMPLSKLSPMQLKKAFQKTYLSENKHLSTYQIDDRFDVSSTVTSFGLDSSHDLSEKGGIRPLEIKIGFRADDAALSRDNYNLLSEYASTVVANPKRAIQISIPERATRSFDERKLAARRLAIVEQVLRDTGVSDTRIIPVLSQRSDDAFVLRIISSDQFETMTSSERDMFGDAIDTKTYKGMRW